MEVDIKASERGLLAWNHDDIGGRIKVACGVAGDDAIGEAVGGGCEIAGNLLPAKVEDRIEAAAAYGADFHEV